MDAYFIVNPVAGRGRTLEHLPRLQAGVPKDLEVSWVMTEAPGHATQLAREAFQSGWQRIVAVGGDGTLSEVVNGLVDTGATVGVLPTGTASDFARCAGLPKTPEESLSALFSYVPQAVDVGLVGGRHFVNVAGVGLDAEVAAEVNRNRRGRQGGTVPYVVALLKVLARYRPTQIHLTIDGYEYSRKALMVAVGNAEAYAGGMRVVPGARVDDGLLNVCVIGDLTRIETLQILSKVYSGGHATHPKVSMHQAAEVKIVCEKPLSVHADGDVVGTTPATFTIKAANLRFLLPSMTTSPRG